MVNDRAVGKIRSAKEPLHQSAALKRPFGFPFDIAQDRTQDRLYRRFRCNGYVALLNENPCCPTRTITVFVGQHDNMEEKNMRPTRNTIGSVCLCLAVILIWSSADRAYSQSTSTYRLTKSVFDGGGGVRQTASYTLWHSIGQASGIGTASTSQYTNHAGFLRFASAGLPGPPIPESTPDPAVIPEPTTVVLVGFGLLLGMVLRRLRKRKPGK